MKKIAMLGAVWLVMTPALMPPAAAQPAAAPRKPASAQGADKMEARVEQRITLLHGRLQITAQQEPAWNGFAKVMRDNAASTEQAYQQRMAKLETMSAVENLQTFAEVEQTRAKDINNLSVAFQSLYGQMSDDQKKIADQAFRHFGERNEGRGRPK